VIDRAVPADANAPGVARTAGAFVKAVGIADLEPAFHVGSQSAETTFD
jgi:hypothetical protein